MFVVLCWLFSMDNGAEAGVVGGREMEEGGKREKNREKLKKGEAAKNRTLFFETKVNSKVVH